MAGDNGNAPELEIVCDFSQVSRRWLRNWETRVTDLMQLAEALTTPTPTNVTDQEMRDWVAARTEVAAEIDRIRASQETMIAQVVREVPREWMSADAPDDVDWSDPASFLDYIQLGYETALVQQVTEQAQAYRKN